MKTYTKLLILSLLLIFFSNPIKAEVITIPLASSGNITLNSTNCNPDQYGFWTKTWIINVPQNTPIKLAYTLYSYDTFSIYTNENGSQYCNLSITRNPSTEEKSMTVLASDGIITINCEYGYSGMTNGIILNLNYSIDAAYNINEESSYNKKDLIVGGKVGIGTITPVEKLHVNGNTIGSGKLAVGIGTRNYLSSDKKFEINNLTDNYSLHSTSIKHTTSSVYGLYSTAANGSGAVYGLYSNVSGGGSLNKRWAGYFNGGDVEVNSGNLKVTKPAASGQYINLTRTGNNPWSIGTVYNTNTFAIGQGTATDADFTAPAFNITQTGNVGVGTSSPGFKFQIRGSNANSDKMTLGSTTTGNFALTSSDGMCYGLFAGVSGTGRAWLQVGRYDSGQAYDLTMQTSGGNVGIGTTVPQSQLHVGGYTVSQLSIGTVSYSGNQGQALGAIQVAQSVVGDGGGILNFQVNPWNQNNCGIYTPITRMTIDQYGKVGIGTTSPNAKLDVNLAATPDGNDLLANFQRTNGNTGGSGLVRINGGNSTADIEVNSGYSSTGLRFGSYFDLNIVNNNTYSPNLYGGINFALSSGVKMAIKPNGNVSIGTKTTNSTDELLTVFGVIHAKEVQVDLTGTLADYVFDENYKLMPLHQVEQFVKTNNHLPEIPSAAEVQKNGLSMGEMQNKLLQKIEELTLYAIEQQKMINTQNAKIEELEKRLK